MPIKWVFLLIKIFNKLLNELEQILDNLNGSWREDAMINKEHIEIILDELKELMKNN